MHVRAGSCHSSVEAIRAGAASGEAIDSLTDLSETEIEHMWVAEAERRENALRTGKARERSAEDVFRDLILELKSGR